MIIKNYNTKNKISLKKNIKILLFIFLILIVLISGICIGIKINQNKIVKSLSTIKQDLLYFFGGEILTDIKNYYNSHKANPEVLIIDIKQKYYDRLAYNRQIAMQRGLLLPSERDEVPATITWRGTKYQVKMRLKGDMPDHWTDEKKWSFRISVKGDNAIMGMKNFSIQSPETRGSLNEWLYHKFLNYIGLISLRYDFVSVKLNGTDLGIYALEEFFEKRLIEHNNRREGPIFRFDESEFMPLLMVKPTDIADIPSFYKEGFTVAQIDAFQTNKIIADTTYYKRFITAKNLMESFRTGKLTTSQIFDIEKLAMFFAANDLFGQWGFGEHHPLEYRNIRFYFNPFNGKIEPIGFDNGYIWYTSQNGLQVENPENYEWINLFFKDSIFINQYIIALNKISEKSFLDKFFENIKDEMQEKLNILYIDSPKYRFYGKNILYENQKYIKTVLNHPAVLNAYFYNAENNKLTIEVGNRQWMPIEIIELSYKDSISFKPEQKVIIPPKKIHQLVEYQKVSFILPKAMKWTPFNVKYLSLKSKSNALNKNYSTVVMPWQYNEWLNDSTNFTLMPSKLEEYNFLAVNQNSKSIFIKPGKHILKNNLIIPQGYTLYAGEGTIIDLKNKANIVSYSPINFVGSKDNPICIISSDSSGQGLAVLNAKGKSYLENVIFNNLSNPAHDSWVLTGSVTFYESDVIIKYCDFVNNRGGDDNLNIVDCKVWVDNCNFINSKADAFDGDFVSACITNSRFVKPGNDGLDFSGSILNINNINIYYPSDKGISMGEVSYANAKNVKVYGGEIAIAAKDLAQIRINNLYVENSKVAFTVYHKKPEFGRGYIMADNFSSKNVKTLHLVEKDSYLIINGNNIKPDMDDVKHILYGVEYGKASQR